MNPSLPVFLILFILSACKSSSDGNHTVRLSGPSGGQGNDIFPVQTPIEGEDDPLASFAWHLDNRGQSAFAARGGKPGEDLKVKEVHAAGIYGRGIRIAVSDSGTEIAHADLADNTLTGEHRSYFGAPSTWRGSAPTPANGDAHGTAVAGLISAVGWNGIGSRGVAPASKFAAFYFIGSYQDTTSSVEARFLDQLTGDFDIFNYSYGFPGCRFFTTSSAVFAAYKRGVTQLRRGLGAIYIKAAGNEYRVSNGRCFSGDSSFAWGNTNTSEEQNHPYLIMAAAVNASGVASSYSSPGSGLWISSTGGEFGSQDPAMITTDLQGCNRGYSSSFGGGSLFNQGQHQLNQGCHYTSVMNGTSSAAPTLAGVVALMLEANPALSWRDVKHILALTADPINFSTAAIPHPGGAGLAGHVYDWNYTVNAAGIRFSNTYGFGRVNARNAVIMAQNYDFPLGRYVETETAGRYDYRSGSLNLSIPDNSATGARHTLSVPRNIKIESIQIKVSIEHPFLSNIGVELTSPSGTTSKLLRINSNLRHRDLVEYVLLTNAFYGEQSQGNWSIRVIDGASGNQGRLQGWELKVNGAE